MRTVEQLLKCEISPNLHLAMHNHNENFFEVGLLDQALISLVLSSQSSKHLCIFGLYGAM